MHQNKTLVFEHVPWVCPANLHISVYTDILYFVSNWQGYKDAQIYFLGGILYLSSDIKHPQYNAFKSYFFSWEHLIVSVCFCCSWGYCAFLVLSFLSLVLFLHDQLLCVWYGEGIPRTHPTLKLLLIWAQIFSQCVRKLSSSLGVSMIHSLVLWPKAKRPVILRSIFNGQNIKAPSKLSGQLF